MRRKLLRTYCTFVTLVSFHFYLTKFEPKPRYEDESFHNIFPSSKEQYH